MSIRRDVLWSVTTDLKGLFEELFRCIHIALFAQPRINQVAILINGSIQVAPLSLDFHVGFINIPRSRLSDPIVLSADGLR